MRSRLALPVLLLMPLCATTFAQKTPPSSGSTTGTYNKTLGPEASTDIGSLANSNRVNNLGRGSVYFAGRVAMAGGELPWAPIPVTVACADKPRFTTETDAKGSFTINPATPVGPSPVPLKTGDAPLSAADLTGCTVRASLAGFQSSTVVLTNRSMTDDPDIGTITLRREEGSKGTAVSGTSKPAPSDAVKAYEKARSEWFSGKPDQAQKNLEKAVHIYPQYAEAWYELGMIQGKANPQGAHDSFSRAVAVDPDFVPPYEQLANLAANSGNWQELADMTNKVLQLDPVGSPRIWFLNATANHKLSQDPAAEASANKALFMDPLHTQPNTEQLLAVLLAARQDYAGAIEHLRSYLTYAPPGPNTQIVRQQIAELEQSAPQSK